MTCGRSSAVLILLIESKNAAGKKTVGKVKNIHKIGDEIYEDQSKR
jgi:predicted ribosome-associated RNA-binding protein Tma20